ncbi:MAG: metal ABC transporter ATP-binding protein [Candidatus Sungbacteria bacterium]|nr:metal ABC transporter ATP-binding protein [Candidatus Sungbacteria bacterium]
MDDKKDTVLAVKNLSVVFGADVVIGQLSFEVKRGEYLTIIGPNGSGKTTLFRALIGVVPYTGSVEWASPDIRIGYVPQKLDIERNVPLSLRDFLISKTEKNGGKDLMAALELVHLSPALLEKPLGSLSGGEFQRALVAFALLGDTNVLLFDEPTAGVDKPSEEQIYETLHRLQDKKGLTILTISHDLSLVNRYADKVLCLNRQGICFGVPEEVLRSETLAELYGKEHYKFFHHLHDEH